MRRALWLLLFITLAALATSAQTPVTGKGIVTGNASASVVQGSTPPSGAICPTTLGWCDNPNTAYGVLCVPADTAHYCYSTIDTWSAGAVDTVHSRLFFTGGGHNDSPDNSVYMYDVGTATITMFIPPYQPFQSIDYCMAANPNGQPAALHTYGGIVYMANVDQIILSAGVPWCTTGNNSDSTWLLNLSTKTWTNITNTMNCVGFSPCSAFSEARFDGGAYDPNSGTVYLTGNFTGVYNYNPITNTMNLFDTDDMGSDYQSSIVDPGRGLLFNIGDNIVQRMNIGKTGLLTNRYTQDSFASSCSVGVNQDAPGLAYDPATGLIVIYPGQGNTLYLYNPDTQSCTSVTYAGGPATSMQNGMWGRFGYVPAYGVFVEANSYTNDVYTLRLDNFNAADTAQRCVAPGVLQCLQFHSAAALQTNGGVVDPSDGWTGTITGTGTTATINTGSQPHGHVVGEQIVIQGCTGVTGFNTSVYAPVTLTAATTFTASWASTTTGTDSSGNCNIENVPVIDATQTGADGGPSLTFYIPPYTSANSSGSWNGPFSSTTGSSASCAPSNQCFGSSTDTACQAGTLVAPCIGSEFYVQYAFRVTSGMAGPGAIPFTNSEGWKQDIINEPGNQSCTAIHIVEQNSNLTGYPQGYHSCGVKDNQYQPFQVPDPSNGDYLNQDGAQNIPPPETTAHAAFNYGGRGSPPGVIKANVYTPGTWMTMLWHVKVGTWYINNSGNYHKNSTVELAIQQQCGPAQPVIWYEDYDLVNNGATTQAGGAYEYGQIWFLPYQTNKVNTQSYPEQQMGVNDVIWSRNRPADSAAGCQTPVLTPTMPDDLAIGSIGTSTVGLSWKDNAGGHATFSVEACAGISTACWSYYPSVGWSVVGTTALGATSFTVTGLSASTTYTFRVRALNSYGYSGYTGGACWNPTSTAGTSCPGQATTN